MITPSYNFDAGKVQGNKLAATEWNYLARVLDSQLNGALSAIGAGVIVEDAANFDGNAELLVSDGGGVLTIAPGRALLKETTEGYGYLYARLGAEQSLALDALEDGENYIYLVPRFADDDATLDTRQGDEPLLEARDSEAVGGGDGALLLAQVTVENGSIATVTDRRTYVGWLQLLARVVQLESDVGYDATARAKGSVAERLDALTSGDGDETPATITYLSQLKYSETDPRNALVVLAEQRAQDRADLEELIATGGRRPMQTKDDVFAHELAIYRQETGKTQLLLRKLFEHLEIDWPVDVGLVRSQSANIVGTSAETEIYGDGSSGFPDHLGPTTLTENTDGSFEP